MEWWKLFSVTFVLIFLAELGDKTQLAALAKTAESPGDSTAKWVVFLGASLALAASTFIAVFLGHMLKAAVPDERYIKLAAGGLFLVFGTMILYEVWQSYHGLETSAVAAAPNHGLADGLAVKAARDFESSSASRYRRLAKAAAPELANLLQALALEEDKHFEQLAGLAPGEGVALRPNFGPPADLAGMVAAITPDGRDLIGELVRQEKATAAFYQSLADQAIIPSFKKTMADLAEEELCHARRLLAATESA